MRTWNIGRLGAAAGLGYVVLTVIGDSIGGSLPATDDPASTIASFFDDHHRAVVVGAVLTGISGPLFLGLLTAIALRLRALGLGAAGAAVFVFGVAGVALGVVSDGLYGSLARIAPGGDAGLAKSLYVLAGFISAKSFWFAAAALLVTGCAAWRVLPRWYALVSFTASVLLGLGGLSLRGHGFFSPFGGMTFVGFAALLLWTLGTCWIVWRSQEEAVPEAVLA